MCTLIIRSKATRRVVEIVKGVDSKDAGRELAIDLGYTKNNGYAVSFITQ